LTSDLPRRAGQAYRFGEPGVVAGPPPIRSRNDVPDRTAYRRATEPKVRAKINAYRRRALDRAVGRFAGMVQIVCFGRNMLWRHIQSCILLRERTSFRGPTGDTGTLATLNCNLLFNFLPAY
jgi:hypothetical protein